MAPTDPKGSFSNIELLKDLGENQNLAFTYYDGMVAYISDNGKSYRWRVGEAGEVGVLANGFDYPAGIVVNGINYGGKKYNFFEITYGGRMIPYLYLFPKAKGEGNTGLGIEPGDLVEGFKDSTTYWDTALFLGGSVDDRANYIPIVETIIGEGPYIPVDGQDGAKGDSAYEVAVVNGFVGTEAEWLLSLKGAKGDDGLNGLSSYQIAVAQGYIGTESEWLIYLKGVDGTNGLSAYQVALNTGYVGTQSAWIASLKGINGVNGLSAYGVALASGFVGTQSEWLASLKGIKGDKGDKGDQGIQGIQGVAGDKGDTGQNYVSNLQKTIVYPTDFTGNNYIVTNADNNYSIFIENGVNNVNLVFPAGLMDKIQVGFLQKGTGDVTAVESGTTIEYLPGLGKKMNGINSNAYIEHYGSSNIIQWIGNIKL